MLTRDESILICEALDTLLKEGIWIEPFYEELMSAPTEIVIQSIMNTIREKFPEVVEAYPEIFKAK